MEYLAISILSENDNNLISELVQRAYDCNCNILETRMTTLGGAFCANILCVGAWSNLAKLDTHLTTLEKKLGLQIIKQRTKLNKFPKDQLPYTVYISAVEEMGTLQKIITFFSEQAIPIKELLTESFIGRRTGKLMLTLSMTINLPADMLLADLRDRFLLFCDKFNFDGSLEMEKG